MLKKDQARYEKAISMCVASALTDAVGWNEAKRIGHGCAPAVLAEVGRCERSRIVYFVEPILVKAMVDHLAWRGANLVAFDVIAALQAEGYPGLE